MSDQNVKVMVGAGAGGLVIDRSRASCHGGDEARVFVGEALEINQLKHVLAGKVSSLFRNGH